jgi:hypothetical protein
VRRGDGDIRRRHPGLREDLGVYQQDVGEGEKGDDGGAGLGRHRGPLSGDAKKALEHAASS